MKVWHMYLIISVWVVCALACGSKYWYDRGLTNGMYETLGLTWERRVQPLMDGEWERMKSEGGSREEAWALWRVEVVRRIKGATK